MNENEISKTKIEIGTTRERERTGNTSHTSRPPAKIRALQTQVTPVPWDGDRSVGVGLLAAPSNWDDDASSVGCRLTPHYCSALNDDCGSDGADDLMIPHDDFC
jgi:hypothetical protein